MSKRLAVVLLVLLGCGTARLSAAPAPAPPALVVVIAIDQFRADFLTRFNDLYLPAQSGKRVGGFRYLQERGAWYPDCQLRHYRTVTAAGHAVLSSGAHPYVSGIVGNSWWDRGTGKGVYSVADPKSTVVGAQAGSTETPMSAANLQVTTVGDELELATGGQARTVSLSLKDRAAILLGGHRTDTSVWFDETTGGWVSSSAYARNGRLPAWVSEVNASRLPDRLRALPWQPSVSAAALERTVRGSRATAEFSHPLTGRDYTPFATSPAGNAFLFESARAAVAAEGLGQDAVPDLLTLNLASNDYVGHRFGPDSAEVLDLSVQTDLQLAEFLNFLRTTVPGGLSRVTIALSADHGVATVPEINSRAGAPGARIISSAIRSATEKALDEGVGPADWIASTENGDLYFGEEALARYPTEARERLEERVVEALRRNPGVFFAVGKSAVLSGKVPGNALGRRITHGVHPARSGDVVVILAPPALGGAAPIGTGTSHGSPFTYDTHLPLLLAGSGIRPGTYGAAVDPAQLAPSLAHLLRVPRPGAADEPLLPGLADLSP